MGLIWDNPGIILQIAGERLPCRCKLNQSDSVHGSLALLKPLLGFSRLAGPCYHLNQFNFVLGWRTNSMIFVNPEVLKVQH